jgi:hypothetical protein
LKKAVILERKEGVIMRKMGRRNVRKEGVKYGRGKKKEK